MHDSLQNHMPPAADKDTARVESFSDGVFAVAMTLLVVGLTVPTVPAVRADATPGYLWHQLAKSWPSYFAFVTSFASVLIMWINHHSIFKLIRRTDGMVLFINGFLLLLVTVVPFPTAVFAAYLLTPAASVACVVYGGTFVLISLAYGGVLIAARRGGHIMPNAQSEVDVRIRSCFCVGTPMYLLATVSGVYSPWPSLGICSVLWVYWAQKGAISGRAFTP